MGGGLVSRKSSGRQGYGDIPGKITHPGNIRCNLEQGRLRAGDDAEKVNATGLGGAIIASASPKNQQCRGQGVLADQDFQIFPFASRCPRGPPGNILSSPGDVTIS